MQFLEALFFITFFQKSEESQNHLTTLTTLLQMRNKQVGGVFFRNFVVRCSKMMGVVVGIL